MKKEKIHSTTLQPRFLRSFSLGFTAVEVLVVISILVILVSVSAYSFSRALKKKELEVTVNAISTTLEKAKVNAQAGNGGQNFGVKFNDDSYVYFRGSSYSSSDSNNVTYPINSAFTITDTITNGSNVIIFSRLDGSTGGTATVTVTEIANSTNKKNVVVEPLGNISVVN